MSTPILVSVEIQTKTCPVCGVHYGVDAALSERRYQEGGAWYCTNGHRLVFAEPEVDQLRTQLQQEQQRSTRLIAERDQMTAEIRDLGRERKRLKREQRSTMRRITNGVCTSCHRHFADVQSHMQRKHPSEVITSERV